jgi:hypothetical protein
MTYKHRKPKKRKPRPQILQDADRIWHDEPPSPPDQDDEANDDERRDD